MVSQDSASSERLEQVTWYRIETADWVSEKERPL
jgi:hypothetical protein